MTRSNCPSNRQTSVEVTAHVKADDGVGSPSDSATPAVATTPPAGPERTASFPVKQGRGQETPSAAHEIQRDIAR